MNQLSVTDRKAILFIKINIIGEKETQDLETHTNTQAEYMRGGGGEEEGDKNNQPEEMLDF